MIKYTANDIIKRAEQLADLENSDFISDYEKLGLLNESFQILYQKIVNTNDKTWIKTINAYDGMCLPIDFYQLSALYVRHTREQITKSNSAQYFGYELKNNHLHLSQNYHNVEVIMEYWPVAPALTFREKTVDAPYNKDVITTDKNIFAYRSQENIIIADVNSDYAYNLGHLSFDDMALYQNGILIKDNGTFKVFRYDIQELDNVTGLIPAIYEDNIYYFNPTTKQIIDLDYNIYIPTFDHDIDETCEIIYFNDRRVYQLCPDYYYCNDNKVLIAERKLKCVMVNDLYTTSLLGKLWCLKPENIEIIGTENPAHCVVSEKYVLTKRSFGNIQFLEGLTDDTILNYPNNIFYTMLAYMLAIQFKIKQSADVSGLSALYEAASNQFFDSINRDSNASYQMKNVYSHRNLIYGY